MTRIAQKFDKIAFVASDVPEARGALERLAKVYGNAEPRTADAIVALGGDGLMLQTLHRHLNDRVPIYGMNRGSVGFLMNDYREDDLRERLARAEVNVIHPLTMRAVDAARPRAHGAGHQRGVAVPRRPTRRPSSGSRSTARCGWRS